MTPLLLSGSASAELTASLTAPASRFFSTMRRVVALMRVALSVAKMSRTGIGFDPVAVAPLMFCGPGVGAGVGALLAFVFEGTVLGVGAGVGVGGGPLRLAMSACASWSVAGSDESWTTLLKSLMAR